MRANEVCKIQALLDLIQDFSNLTIRVKRCGDFYERIYFSKQYGNIYRRVYGRHCWSFIGAFNDLLPRTFVLRRQYNEHLLTYYEQATQWRWLNFRITHRSHMCEICGIARASNEVDGAMLCSLSYLFDCDRPVSVCQQCLKVVEDISVREFESKMGTQKSSDVGHGEQAFS